MLSVFQLERFVSPFKIAGTREIGGFRILRRSAKCTPRPNLKAARKKVVDANLIKLVFKKQAASNKNIKCRNATKLITKEHQKFCLVVYNELCWAQITNTQTAIMRQYWLMDSK